MWYNLLIIWLIWINRNMKKSSKHPYSNDIPLLARILVDLFQFIYWIGSLILTVVIIGESETLFPTFYNDEPSYVYFMTALYVTIYCIIMIAIFATLCILFRIKFNHVIMITKKDGMTMGRLLYGPSLFIVSTIIYIIDHFIL